MTALPNQTTTLATELKAIISVAATWNGTYSPIASAILEHLVLASAGQGIDRLDFTVPYGTVYVPGSGFALASPDALLGQWVQLVLTDGVTPVTVFVGQIRAEDRTTYGSDSDDPASMTAVPKGDQRWSAFGGMELLRLTTISKSTFVDAPGTGVVTVAWTPAFNLLDAQGQIVGNRSTAHASDDATTYVFGGTSNWSRADVVGYIVKRFLSTGGQPAWTVSDPLGALAETFKNLPMGPTQTVAEVLEHVIRHREALDFACIPQFSAGAFTGYQITIFSLVAASVTFGGATIPANTNVITFDSSAMQSCESLKITNDQTKTPARIRIVGARILVCATLLAPTLSGFPGDDILTSTNSTLIGKWTSTLETDYLAGDSTASASDDPDQHDAARSKELFRNVYLRYALPKGWARQTSWVPLFDGTMVLVGGTPAPYQDQVRSTESWVPLIEGIDYVTGGGFNPTDEQVPDFRTPFVICEDRVSYNAKNTDPMPTAILSYINSDRAHFGHSALKKDLGILMHSSPNHRLARNRWTTGAMGTAPSNFEPDTEDETWGRSVDARTLAATIAWRSDAIAYLEKVNGAITDDGTVMEFSEPDMQIWWLANSTIVDVVNGQPVTNASNVILRNDAALYEPIMAGLIARYLSPRPRVDATFRGWYAWLPYLGNILTVTESGASGNTVSAPITAIELHGGMNPTPRTQIRAGYA